MIICNQDNKKQKGILYFFHFFCYFNKESKMKQYTFQVYQNQY